MKYLQNTLLKLNLKGLIIIATIVFLSVLPLLMTRGFAQMDASDPSGYMDSWGPCHTVNTTYAGAVKVPDWLTNKITEKYGAEAAKIYDQCVATGDYVPYRQYTGYWTEHEVSRDFTGYATGPADIWEGGAILLGVYGTVQDYINWCNEHGYKPNDPEDKKRMTADCVYGRVAWPTHITKAQYQKNHAAAAQAAANQAAAASQAEALKTYKGNTSEFNAYNYYSRYADLQAAIGPNGDALLKHYNEFGKAEGRNAK